MKIAVLFQYPELLSQLVLLPIAFTMEATQVRIPGEVNNRSDDVNNGSGRM